MNSYISAPQIERPTFEIDQTKALDWLAEAHSKADPSIDRILIRKLLQRYGCGPDKISSRGTFLEDSTHTNWDQMEIFRFDQTRAGADMTKRMSFYAQRVNTIFEDFYAHEQPPENLIHVSCTGYVSPSGAQKVVSNRNCNTVVTHAYHMGCYAAVPAIRIADGFLKAGSPKVRTDIVHTELCTLHMNPLSHEPEQLVVQSLFADGLCKYTLSQEKPTKGFKIMKYREEIVPQSQEAMTWGLAGFGMHMTLHRDVPDLIKAQLRGFIERLTGETKLSDFEFAVHPGGPKIIEGVQNNLELTEEQVTQSKQVLYRYGNMSSATLPHVWSKMAEVDGPERIVSLAFGPGLTICGVLMERV